MRPHEHPAAEAPDFHAGFINQVDRIRLCAKAARDCARRAPIHCPYGLAVSVDRDSIGTAQGRFVRVRVAQSRMAR
jgi:hypothetical protein